MDGHELGTKTKKGPVYWWTKPSPIKMVYAHERSWRYLLRQRIAAQQAVRPIGVGRIGEKPLEQQQAVYSQDAGDHRQLGISV